ncbi:glycoside hydrolase family 10 protein [Myxosarcina sp. GI1]|uniref:glycoside hydrolase family 10 protein n=1 Tax=Myxosarcina sp. GI1 TaxID=1541065 RepID=UPI00056679F5|nr:family 10 glycosylhydrolase [Myxosarcina sp. GI1]
MLKWYRRLTIFFVSYFLIICFWQAPAVEQIVKGQELRGIWMTNYGSSLAYHTTRLDEVVANIAKHQLNTIYPAVWNRGYTLYPSPVTQQAEGRKQDFLTTLTHEDILSSLVYQAHRQHLRLIPWFEYGLMIPTTSAIARKHPDWLTTTKNGDIVKNYRGNKPNWIPKRLFNFKEEITGLNQGWLNPFHPEVQNFLTDLIVDVVQRYSIDGIQLDDHFGLPVEFGYDSYTIELYRQEHYGSSPPNNFSDPEWLAWRAEKITQFMTQLVKKVRAANDKAVISLSPNLPDFAYQKYLQNWSRWVELDLLDEVIVQVYRPTNKLAGELNNNSLSYLKQKTPIAIGLYTGPFHSPKTSEQIQREVEIVRNAAYNGVSFFCWETTLWLFKSSSATSIEQTFQHLFN